MAIPVTDRLLAYLQTGLLASTSVKEGNPNADASISQALSDYYLDKNYGLGGAGADPKRVKIVFQSTGEEAKLGETYNYPNRAALMFSDPSNMTSKFGTIKDIGEFVQKVVYLTVSNGLDEVGYIGSYDIKDPVENERALTELSSKSGVSDTEASNLRIVKHTESIIRPEIERRYTPATATKKSDGTVTTLDEQVVKIVFVVSLALRPWLAYQCIDYVPVGVAGGQKYDSFLETQVRQLTKVVFVANLLRAAYVFATSAEAKQAIVRAFNNVLDIPKKDPALLGDFLNPGSKKHLDVLYQENVVKSAELYDAATELEGKDVKMRQAQDNLRAINTNDELMTAVRRRAYIMYVVVWVMIAALVGALTIAFATGNSGIMYATVAVVFVLVLLSEVTRGIAKLLRI